MMKGIYAVSLLIVSNIFMTFLQLHAPHLQLGQSYAP